MSSVSSCPKCNEQVLLPPGAVASATVRCPLCQAEFPLEEVLAQLPPMLVVVESGVPAMAAGFMSHDAPESADDDMLLTASSGHAGEQTPAGDFDFAAAEVDEAALDPDEVDTVLDEERRPAIKFGERLTGFDQTEEPDDGFAPVAGGLDGVRTFREASPDVGEEIELDHGHDESLEHVSHNEDDNPFGEGSVAIKPVKTKRRREPSAIGNLIGVVGGGFLGLGLGYLILLWIGGPEKDLLGYAEKFPKWMLPAAFSEPQEDTETSGMATEFPNSEPDQQQVAQNPIPPKKPPKRPAPLDTSNELPLNVPSLPEPGSEPTPPRGKPAEPLEMPLEKPEPSLELPAAPTLDAPLIAPPVARPQPKPTPTEEPMPEKPAEPKPEPTTPEPTEKPTPKPEPPKTDDIPPPAENLGLKEPPSYPAEDLEKATKDARDVGKQLADAVAAGGADVKPLMRQFYVNMYKLSEVLTFVEGDPTDPQLAESKESVQQTALELAADPAKVKEIAAVANQWLGRPQHGEHDGVLLSGTVQSAAKNGKMFETKIALAAGDKVVTVLAAEDPKLKKDDQVLVLGSIVDQPAQKLFAYSGEEPTIIWNGLTLKLPPGQ